MTRQVAEFFKDNFGKEYHPVLHGRCETITPLALIVKQKKKWYNRRSHLVAVANLAKYVVEENRPAHRKLAEKRMKKIEKRLGKEEVERLEERVNSEEYNLEVDEVIGASCITKDFPGDLVLGQLDEEYFEDPDLREILKESPLDEEKMKPFDDAQRMYIVTSVVYSDKFKIKGKSEHTDTVSCHVNTGKLTKVLLPETIPADISGKRSRTNYPAPWIERKGRGALLFAYIRVNYSKRDCRLCLSDFVGKDICARGPLPEKKVYETVVDEEQRGVEEIFAIEDLEGKLENVQKFLFTSEMDKRKELLRTYLRYSEAVFEELLVELEETPTAEQSNLLQKFGFKVGGEVLLKPESGEKFEAVRLEYGKIFKHLEGLSDEKWTEFLECANGNDSEDGMKKTRKTKK